MKRARGPVQRRYETRTCRFCGREGTRRSLDFLSPTEAACIDIKGCTKRYDRLKPEVTD